MNYVVIPSYNGRHLLERCVRSVTRSAGTWIPLVVDNNSSDGTDRADIENLGAMYIQHSTNEGFGAACNTGLWAAMAQGARNVAILNQDAWVKKSALNYMAETLQADPGAALVCPLQLQVDGGLHSNFAQWLVAQNKHILDDGIFRDVENVYRVEFLNAACWMLNPQVLHRLGGFDPIFFMYCEDKEFCARAALHGFHALLDTRAIIVHDKCLTADQSSVIQRIAWASVNPTANMLGAMRNYKRAYLRNLPRAVLDWTKGCVANLLAVNGIATAGYLLTTIRFSRRFVRNWQNYERCKHGVPDLFFKQ